RAELVRVRDDHLVEVAARKPEGLLAYLAHGDAVREQAELREHDPAAGLQRALHRVRVDGLDADDSYFGPQPLDAGRDPADQPAAADRDEDRMDRLAALAEDLESDGPLPGNDVGIVVGVDEREPAAAGDPLGRRMGFLVRVALEHELRSTRCDGIDLDSRR